MPAVPAILSSRLKIDKYIQKYIRNKPYLSFFLLIYINCNTLIKNIIPKRRINMAQFNVRDMDEQVMYQLKLIAKEKGINFSELVREVLENYVENRLISSQLTRFEVALRNTQISLDANTEAYNKFLDDNKRFRGFIIDMITKEDFLINDDNYNIAD